MLLLCSIHCFSQKSLQFHIKETYTRDQNEIGTWNNWVKSSKMDFAPTDFRIDFDDNEIIWEIPDTSTGKVKYITQLLLKSKTDNKYKNLGFSYLTLNAAGLKDDKTVVYDIGYFDTDNLSECILITSSPDSQTKYILQPE